MSMPHHIPSPIDHGAKPVTAVHGNSVGPGNPFLSVSWLGGAIRFERSRWRCPETSRRSTDAAHHRLVLVESGGSKRTIIRIDGLRVYRGRDWPLALSFVPAGVERCSTYLGVDLTYSALLISPAAERMVLGSDRGAAFSPLTNVRDPVISCLLSSLGQDVQADAPPVVAYLEHLAALILYRLQGPPPGAELDRRHRPLEAAFIRRTDEYIRAHPDENIAVATLAGLCGMRTDTFARRFRAATGKAPYAYILAWRVERAQQLLKTTRADLATVALDLGFASQSHLTTVFRKMVGVTPAQYRARYRPKS
jgi:AraC family transcriptional regulator